MDSSNEIALGVLMYIVMASLSLGCCLPIIAICRRIYNKYVLHLPEEIESRYVIADVEMVIIPTVKVDTSSTETLPEDFKCDVVAIEVVV